MTIPEIRARLYYLAWEYGIEELRELADATCRRKPLRRRARPLYPRLTRPLQAVAKHLYFQRGLNIHTIAFRLGTNNGRVSETVHPVDPPPDPKQLQLPL